MPLTGYFRPSDPDQYSRISETEVIYMYTRYTPETDFYALLKEMSLTGEFRRPLRDDVPDVLSGVEDLLDHLGDTVMAKNMAEAAIRILEESRTEPELDFGISLWAIYRDLPNAPERFRRAFSGKSLSSRINERVDYVTRRMAWALEHPKPTR